MQEQGSVISCSGSYLLNRANCVVHVDTSTGNGLISLPALAEPGTIVIHKINSGPHNVTLVVKEPCRIKVGEGDVHMFLFGRDGTPDFVELYYEGLRYTVTKQRE